MFSSGEIKNVIALGDVEADKDSGDPNRETEARAFENLKHNLRGVASILYYKPLLVYGRQVREPDILWIHPHVGVLVIEVKAWSLEFFKECRIGDNDRFLWKGKSFPDPNREAREFVNTILDLTGKRVPVRYVLYFPNLTPSEYEELPELFKGKLPKELCLFKHEKNVLLKLLSAFEGYQRSMLKKPVTEEDFNAVRKALFPHKTVSKSDFSFTDEDIPVLDIYQESLLYSLKRGYRILRGTAGSGKTVVLIAKGVQEKLSDPSKRVIFITYANSLVSEIKNSIGSLIKLRGLPLKVEDFEITTIHALMGRVYRKYVGDNRDIGYERLESGVTEYVESNTLNDEDRYDVILVDESQDFRKHYFKLIKALEKEDTITVFGVDETQRIYEYEEDGTAPWVWSGVGYDARGRTDVLKRSYRNPSKIFKVAVDFLKRDRVLADRLKELEIEDAYSIRTDEGVVRMFVGEDEFELVDRILKHLIGRGYNAGDIFILCAVQKLVRGYAKVAQDLIGSENVRYFSSNSLKQFKEVPTDKLMVIPYKSAKGLERPVVIVTGTHILPYEKSKLMEQKRLDRRTLYVALTRAQKELYITAQELKGFAEELKGIIDTN
ncbi:UvrD-helicase domain-containing protein [Hydrogenivirga sp. 128-5-R1-1]|uniref:nuclease-related domain-containing DEAD/DEAH box helicase n=1 Tax=Hydrogenivirga sp. 128-5-R1-1 TaxID=392423 RepID=UPI00015F18EA|nr:UvrD-helicase domain-containing protein [Hydrogenivirga sp. 128-5-R1-1]EDP75399.1 hypothetical protein HG1285_15581 [Hydrogenivirga sp. 128-5-R1-1]